MKNRLTEFRDIVWKFYQQRARLLPWRTPEPDGSFDPYKILVSEVMLQQTQVSRVIPKYQIFLEQLPTLKVLASASLTDVLRAWNGLGYNRRAQYLHHAARQLINIKEPWTIKMLMDCKGIGYNTAAAVMVYAYNQPVSFIETNVRTAYIYHFFAHTSGLVADKELQSLVDATISHDHPREWYWALMDYGSFLKSSAGNFTQKSKHYTKQSNFHGSSRQLRGMILRLLLAGNLSQQELIAQLADDRLATILKQLMHEGLIKETKGLYKIAK